MPDPFLVDISQRIEDLVEDLKRTRQRKWTLFI